VDRGEGSARERGKTKKNETCRAHVTISEIRGERGEEKITWAEGRRKTAFSLCETKGEEKCVA